MGSMAMSRHFAVLLIEYYTLKEKWEGVETYRRI